MTANTTFGVMLVALSVALVSLHRRAHAAAASAGDAATLTFSEAQLRRRTQASGLIGILGVAIAAYSIVPRQPAYMVAYLVTLAVALIWMVWLACVDWWATRVHYRRLQQQQWEAQARLAGELYRAATDEDAG